MVKFVSFLGWRRIQKTLAIDSRRCHGWCQNRRISRKTGYEPISCIYIKIAFSLNEHWWLIRTANAHLWIYKLTLSQMDWFQVFDQCKIMARKNRWYQNERKPHRKSDNSSGPVTTNIWPMYLKHTKTTQSRRRVPKLCLHNSLFQLVAKKEDVWSNYK